jgi:hypothetical protein
MPNNVDKSNQTTDFSSNQELLNTINAWKAMLKVYGKTETLETLTAFDYKDSDIKLIAAKLRLPKSINRTAMEGLVLPSNTNITIKLSLSKDRLLDTINIWNAMLKVHGPTETLDALATFGYGKAVNKMITANLQLPKSINRIAETEKIINASKSNKSPDFSSNKKLLKTIDIFKEMLNAYKLSKTLEYLAKLSYTPISIKLIMANLNSPEIKDRETITKEIIEANQTNIIANSNKNRDKLSSNQNDQQTQNNMKDFIYKTFIKPNIAEKDLPRIKDLSEKAINSTPNNPLSNTKKDKTSPQR